MNKGYNRKVRTTCSSFSWSWYIRNCWSRSCSKLCSSDFSSIKCLACIVLIWVIIFVSRRVLESCESWVPIYRHRKRKIFFNFWLHRKNMSCSSKTKSDSIRGWKWQKRKCKLGKAHQTEPNENKEIMRWFSTALSLLQGSDRYTVHNIQDCKHR